MFYNNFIHTDILDQYLNDLKPGIQKSYIDGLML